MTRKLGLGLIPIALPFSLLAVFLAARPGNSYDSRPLTSAQLIAIENLAFPQSAQAMLGTFGEPAAREGDLDIYPDPYGGSIAVVYVGNRAFSVRRAD